MTIQTHDTPNGPIAEVHDFFISDISSGTDLIGNAYYQGFEKVIIHQKDISPEFFDLKTKLAGEILQKFSNYRMKLAIVGDFKVVKSTSLQDFIRESNKFGQINFAETIEEAVNALM